MDPTFVRTKGRREPIMNKHSDKYIFAALYSKKICVLYRSGVHTRRFSPHTQTAPKEQWIATKGARTRQLMKSYLAFSQSTYVFKDNLSLPDVSWVMWILTVGFYSHLILSGRDFFPAFVLCKCMAHVQLTRKIIILWKAFCGDELEQFE